LAFIHVIVGVGNPLAWQWRETGCWNNTETSCGSINHVGATATHTLPRIFIEVISILILSDWTAEKRIVCVIFQRSCFHLQENLPCALLFRTCQDRITVRTLTIVTKMFCGFTQFLQANAKLEISNYVTIAPFHIFSKRLFTDHLRIQRYTFWATDSAFSVIHSELLTASLNKP
jgi:hypothetical protein